ncbi:MAG: metallophosphoesterase [Clostridiales bacterium]|nr:metallophosphoesterase [Clostridiales bacterium]
MSKVFVVPDVHLKPQMFEEAEKLLSKVPYDQVLLLGDLVDDWDQQDNLMLYRKTLDEAARFIRKYDALFCYGNHDVSYRWGMLESGYSYTARYIVEDGLREIERVADGGLFTYLGSSPGG